MKKYVNITLMLLIAFSLNGCNKSKLTKPIIPDSKESTQTNISSNESTDSKPITVQNIKLVEKPNKTKYRLRNGIKINYNNKNISTNKGSIPIMLPQIDGLADKALEKNLNKTIENDVISEAKRYMEETEDITNFAEVRAELNANNLLCISIRGYYKPPVYGFLYKLTDGKKLTLKDIFTQGTDYVSLLNRKVTEGILADEELEENFLREPFKTITPDQNFALSPSHLYIVFNKGESGFQVRRSIAVPLSDIDNYVDVLDRYSGTERKTQLNSELFVRNNNIFINPKGKIYKRNDGNIWIRYPEITGLRNEELESKIASVINSSIDELKDSSLFNGLPKGNEYNKDCLAYIELRAAFSHYGILSIERFVGTFTNNSFDNLHKVYSFNLKESKVMDTKDFFINYLSKHQSSKDIFVNGVKDSINKQYNIGLKELKPLIDINVDYEYIRKNSLIYFTKLYDEDELFIHTSFILNTGFRADAVIPLKDIHQGAPEDFFGW